MQRETFTSLGRNEGTTYIVFYKRKDIPYCVSDVDIEAKQIDTSASRHTYFPISFNTARYLLNNISAFTGVDQARFSAVMKYLFEIGE